MKKKQNLAILAAFLIQFFVFNIANNLIPFLLPTILNFRGIQVETIQYTQYNLLFTIGIFASAVVSPIIPVMFKKLGLKITFLIGCLVASLSFWTLALIPNSIDTNVQIYLSWLAGAGIYAGSAIISSIGIPNFLTKWFSDKEKGKALGFVFMGGGLGNLTCLLLFNLIPQLKPGVENLQLIFAIFSIVGLIASILISLFLIKAPTAEESAQIQKENESTTTVGKGYTLAEVIKSSKYICFIIGLFFLGCLVSGLSTQFNTFYKEIGAPYSVIALIFAIFSVVGNQIGGYLFDKVGRNTTLIYAGVLLLISVGCLISQQTNLGYVFGVTFGLGVFAYLLLPGFLVGDLFGTKDYGNILAISNMFFAIGFGLGVLIFSTILQKFGWTGAWGTIGVFVIIAFTSFLAASSLKITNANK